PSRLRSRPDALITYPVLAIMRFRCAPRPPPPFGSAIAAFPGVARSPKRGHVRAIHVMTALHAAMAHAAVPSRAKSIVTETLRSPQNRTTQPDRPIPKRSGASPHGESRVSLRPLLLNHRRRATGSLGSPPPV